VFVAWKFSGPNFWQFVMIVTFAHYALAFLYSRRQFVAALSSLRTALPLALVTLAGYGMYVTKFPVAVFFGVHHIFNETYLLQREVYRDRAAETRTLRMAGMFFNAALYATILRHEPGLNYFGSSALFGALLVSSALFFYVLFKMRKRLSVRELIDSCIFEIASSLIVVFSLFRPFTFLHLVLYHILFWSVYPLSKLSKQGGAAVPVYVALHATAVPIAWLFAPAGPLASGEYYSQFYLWSFIHIAASFSLSTAQPGWVNWIFQPRAKKPFNLPASLPTGGVRLPEAVEV